MMYKNIIIIFFLVLGPLRAQEKLNTITGFVTDLGQPMANVDVKVKGASKRANTDLNGKYSIKAKLRDVLVFSHLGKKSVEIIIEDVTAILNIEMLPKVEHLNEVVVQKTKLRTQKDLRLEYATNKNLIRTAFGIIDKKASGFAMTFMDEDDITAAHNTFLDVIRGKLNGRIEDPNGVHPKVYLNSGFSNIIQGKMAVAYDVDGFFMIEAPIFIHPSEIKRMVILNGNGAISRYGTRGSGGVIIINTKMGNILTEPGSDQVYDRALLRDNIFDEKSVKNNFVAEDPIFLKELNDCTTKQKAVEVFEKQKGRYDFSPYYLLQVGNFFLKRWKDIEKANEVFDLMQERFSRNAPALKALAYIYEENGNFEVASEIYKKVFKLRPRYAQSYRDLANSYAEIGLEKKAMALYGRYGKFIRDTLSSKMDFIGIDSVIRVEARNLFNKGADLNSRKNNIYPHSDYWPVRIVVEWNNSEAEFDLQFVNPQKHYYIWHHTREDLPERLRDEKLRGYSSEQFILDENSKGKWLLNLKYFGNKSFDPTFLKITTIYDYGTSYSRKEIKVFKLWEKNNNQELFSLYNNVSAISR